MLQLPLRQSHKKPRYIRWALGLFGLLLIFLLIAGYLVFDHLVQREERQTVRTLNQFVTVQSEAMASWISERVGDAEVFSNGAVLGETVHNWVTSGAPSNDIRDQIQAQLRAIKESYGYLEVAIVDPGGNYYLGSEPEGEGSNMLRSAAARRTVQQAVAFNRPSVSTIHAGRNPGEPQSVVDVAAPLLDLHARTGKAGSVLLLRADASNQLDPFVAAMPLADTQTQAVLTEIIDGRVMTIAASSNAVHFSGFGELPVDAATLLAAAREGKELLLEDPTRIGYRPDSAPSASIGAVREVRGTPWFLVTMIDSNATRAYITRLAWLVALIAGGALVLSGLALVLWTRERESLLRLRTFRAATEKALLQRHYDYLSRYANDMIILTDRNGRMLEVNEKTLQLLGRERSSVIGQAIDMLFLPECRPQVEAALARLAQDGNARFEAEQRGYLGTLLIFEGSARALERDGQVILQFIFRDITERRRSEAALRESRQRIDSIMNSIGDIVWSFAPDLSRTNYINRSVERLLGYPVEAFERTPGLWLDCMHPDDRREFEAALAATTPSHPMLDLEIRFANRDGRVRWLHCRGRLESDAHGRPLRLDGVASDITQRKEAEQQVQRLAYYDSVTRLPNRTLLIDRLKQAMSMAARSTRKVALLFMDLDNFKNINDSLGHQVGDQLLRTVAERLLQCVRSEDTVARIGGDEFLIALPNLDRPEQAAGVAEKILATAARPFDIAGHQIHTTISIGIAVFPDDTTELHELVRHADSALYQAKGLGRNNFQFFTAELNEQITRNSEIERRLRQALDAGALKLWYQPQVDTHSGRLVGAEALARWRIDGNGFMPPAEFIAVAEERGLIARLGEWALREACSQCRRWLDQGLNPVPLAVNVSPIQFQQKGFAELVTGILDESGLDGRYLELEITESALMRRAGQAAKLTLQLRESGVGISIDDFGTGYSSLSYLRQLPIDKIKIDRSFISDLEQEGAITRAIVELAHSLHLRVVAEGVESQAQIERLRAFDCDQVQGFYYSSALSADDFAALLGGCRTLTQGAAPALP